MSDTDPRPPRRRINGVTWVWHDWLCAGASGNVYGLLDRVAICRIGYAMGCVKDDDGGLPDTYSH